MALLALSNSALEKSANEPQLLVVTMGGIGSGPSNSSNVEVSLAFMELPKSPNTKRNGRKCNVNIASTHSRNTAHGRKSIFRNAVFICRPNQKFSRRHTRCKHITHSRLIRPQ
ncbi:hypothetical protein VTN31DRAFT_3176 [Thermomyces dupontii]|uniref:uncharacterized protein n=1 Tax=Talaromyces thermophilus TaxID=28565 RepID=UPI00374349F2